MQVYAGNARQEKVDEEEASSGNIQRVRMIGLIQFPMTSTPLPLLPSLRTRRANLPCKLRRTRQRGPAGQGVRPKEARFSFQRPKIPSIINSAEGTMRTQSFSLTTMETTPSSWMYMSQVSSNTLEDECRVRLGHWTQLAGDGGTKALACSTCASQAQKENFAETKKCGGKTSDQVRHCTWKKLRDHQGKLGYSPSALLYPHPGLFYWCKSALHHYEKQKKALSRSTNLPSERLLVMEGVTLESALR